MFINFVCSKQNKRHKNVIVGRNILFPTDGPLHRPHIHNVSRLFRTDGDRLDIRSASPQRQHRVDDGQAAELVHEDQLVCGGPRHDLRDLGGLLRRLRSADIQQRRVRISNRRRRLRMDCFVAFHTLHSNFYGLHVRANVRWFHMGGEREFHTIAISVLMTGVLEIQKWVEVGFERKVSQMQRAGLRLFSARGDDGADVSASSARFKKYEFHSVWFQSKRGCKQCNDRQK